LIRRRRIAAEILAEQDYQRMIEQGVERSWR